MLRRLRFWMGCCFRRQFGEEGPASPAPPVSTVEGIIYPLWASVSQPALISPPHPLPWLPISLPISLFWVPHHTAACVLPLCCFFFFSVAPKQDFLLQRLLKTKAFDTLGLFQNKKKGLPGGTAVRLFGSFAACFHAVKVIHFKIRFSGLRE